MKTTNNTELLWRQPPPQAEYIAAAETYDVPATTAATAWRNLATGQAAGIAFSGKPASGKDTVAPRVLARLGVAVPGRVGFTWALKREVTGLISVVREVATARPRINDEAAVAQLTELYGVDNVHARAVTELLWDEVRIDNTGLTGETRNGTVRALLHYWGTDVRRTADPMYWVRKPTRQLYDMLAAGRYVQITDLRFRNEAVAVDIAGLVTARLDVTPETQQLRSRDRGATVDTATVAYPSEELDSFEGFTVRVSNDGPLDETVETVYRQLAGRR